MIGQQAMEIWAMEWHVIVMLEEQQDFTDICKAIVQVKKHVLLNNEVWGLECYLERLKTHWARRGIIDGVGLIDHSLFGVATDLELIKLSKKKQENRQALQHITYWSHQWTSVVNVSYTIARQNRMAVTNLTKLWQAFQKKMQ